MEERCPHPRPFPQGRWTGLWSRVEEPPRPSSQEARNPILPHFSTVQTFSLTKRNIYETKILRILHHCCLPPSPPSPPHLLSAQLSTASAPRPLLGSPQGGRDPDPSWAGMLGRGILAWRGAGQGSGAAREGSGWDKGCLHGRKSQLRRQKRQTVLPNNSQTHGSRVVSPPSLGVCTLMTPISGTGKEWT